MTWASRPAPPLGATVTLQVDTPVGSIGVVGVLLDTDSATWSVRRRDGSVSPVAVDSIRACRIVPPGPAARASVVDVERVAMSGWRAVETAPLGDWRLRASGGFTGRANSVLALGEPGVDIETALAQVTAWYDERRLPVRLQLIEAEAPAGLGPALERSGWATSPAVEVRTAGLGHVLRAAAAIPAPGEIRLDAEPDDAWLGCYRDGAATPRDAARAVLVNHPAAVFVSIREGDRCVAVARGAVDGKWAGVHAVEVASSHRGNRLGAVVTAAALRWCGERGARRSYLQVSADNAPAVALYERLNYSVHHHYVYRQRP